MELGSNEARITGTRRKEARGVVSKRLLTSSFVENRVPKLHFRGEAIVDKGPALQNKTKQTWSIESSINQYYSSIESNNVRRTLQ